MANVIRTAAPVAAPSAADPYYEAQKQQALAELLAARAHSNEGRPPLTAQAATFNGLNDILASFASGKAADRAQVAKAGADRTISGQNAALIQAMMRKQGVQVEGLDDGSPDHAGFTTPGKLDPMANDLTQAVSGMDPMAVKSSLSKVMLERAMPDPSQVADRELKASMAAQAAADRQAALEERSATRAQRMAELEARLANNRVQAEERAALQREIAQMRNENALELQRMRNEAATNKVDAATAAAEAPKAAAKAQLDGQIAAIRDMYTQLGKAGGITDTDKPVQENVSAAIRSSAVGQFAGKVLGTKEQSLRNQIQQARPILLQQIKAATGMSAQQMNSNVELRLFLEAATDPKLDIQANMKALDGLEAFVNGGVAPSAPAAPAGGVRSFATVEEAEAAGLPAGTKITIGGRSATVQ